MKQPNRIFLFYPTSIIGWIITLVTRTPFAHAAIEIDGQLYDSSEKRGNFGPSEIDPRKRRNISFRFDGCLAGWLGRMNGREYDWLGVFGWLVGASTKGKFYCFDAARSALRDVGVVGESDSRQVSGVDLMHDLLAYAERISGGGLMDGARLIVREFELDFESDFNAAMQGPDAMDVAQCVVDIAVSESGAESVLDAISLSRSDKDIRISIEAELYARLPGVLNASGV